MLTHPLNYILIDEDEKRYGLKIEEKNEEGVNEH